MMTKRGLFSPHVTMNIQAILPLTDHSAIPYYLFDPLCGIRSFFDKAVLPVGRIFINILVSCFLDKSGGEYE